MTQSIPEWVKMLTGVIGFAVFCGLLVVVIALWEWFAVPFWDRLWERHAGFMILLIVGGILWGIGWCICKAATAFRDWWWRGRGF